MWYFRLVDVPLIWQQSPSLPLQRGTIGHLPHRQSQSPTKWQRVRTWWEKEERDVSGEGGGEGGGRVGGIVEYKNENVWRKVCNARCVRVTDATVTARYPVREQCMGQAYSCLKEVMYCSIHCLSHLVVFQHSLSSEQEWSNPNKLDCKASCFSSVGDSRLQARRLQANSRCAAVSSSCVRCGTVISSDTYYSPHQHHWRIHNCHCKWCKGTTMPCSTTKRKPRCMDEKGAVA